MDELKLYPLLTSQKLIFLAQEFTVHKQVMNIPTSFLVETPLDLELLRKAAETAVSRNDSFGMRFTRRGKEKMVYFTDRKALFINTVDFTGKTDDDMEAFFYKVGRKKMKMYDMPLVKIYIVRAPDGACGVFSCINHLILDSWAISMFYKDLMGVYLSYRDQTPLPKPPRDYEPLLLKDIEYKSTERYSKDMEFWEHEIAGNGVPLYSGINGTAMLQKYRKQVRQPDRHFCRNFFLRTAARHETILVDAQLVGDMKSFCSEHGIPMQTLFQMGLRTCLARACDRQEDVSFNSILARRGTIEEKTAGGTRAQALPCRTVMKENTTFLDGLGMLLEKQNNFYRHADVDTMELFDIMYRTIGMKRGEDYNTVALTFQPLAMDFGNELKIRTKWYCNGASAQTMYLTIMDGDGTGALRCYYEYIKAVIKAETIQKCHDYMIRVIRAGIANPDITLKALLDMDF